MKHRKKVSKLIRRQKVFDNMKESDKKGYKRPGSIKKG